MGTDANIKQFIVIQAYHGGYAINFNPLSLYKPAAGNTAKVIIGNKKQSKDTPLIRDLIYETLPLMEKEEKKPQVDQNSGPLDYETVTLTTLPPPTRPHTAAMLIELRVAKVYLADFSYYTNNI